MVHLIYWHKRQYVCIKKEKRDSEKKLCSCIQNEDENDKYQNADGKRSIASMGPDIKILPQAHESSVSCAHVIISSSMHRKLQIRREKN